MVGIQGISGVPEPTGPRPAPGRGTPPPTSDSTPTDGTSFSPEASKAAQVQSLISSAEGQSDLRVEKVAEAKANIEQGTHKLQEAVLQVAARVSQIID